MEYKINDKIIIKKWDSLLKDYSLSPEMGAIKINGFYFSKKMESFCRENDRIFTIKDIIQCSDDNLFFFLNINNKTFGPYPEAIIEKKLEPVKTEFFDAPYKKQNMPIERYAWINYGNPDQSVCG